MQLCSYQTRESKGRLSGKHILGDLAESKYLHRSMNIQITGIGTSVI